MQEARLHKEGSMSGLAVSKDIFDYDGRLLDGLKQRQDAVTSFAIQNYLACGAVAFLHFNGNNTLPISVAAALILLLCINFIIAIAANVFVAKKLYAMHRLAVEHWFGGSDVSTFYDALSKSPEGRAILQSKEFPCGFDFRHPSVFANSIPAIGVLLFWFIVSYYPQLIW
jgi:hypothetical protein